MHELIHLAIVKFNLVKTGLHGGVVVGTVTSQ